MNLIEDVRKPAFMKVLKNIETSGKEVQNHLYIVPVNKDRQQKNEKGNKIKHEIDEAEIPMERGLPSQPEGYIKYSDYDCL
jgi:hypothetical protein